MFKKTNQHRIFEDLVVQIEDAILDGRLKAGDKLPAQRYQTGGDLMDALERALCESTTGLPTSASRHARESQSAKFVRRMAATERRRSTRNTSSMSVIVPRPIETTEVIRVWKA